MNETRALNWLEQQAGLRVIIGKDRHVTLTDGMTVEITGVGIIDTVKKLLTTLEDMQQCETRMKNNCG